MQKIYRLLPGLNPQASQQKLCPELKVGRNANSLKVVILLLLIGFLGFINPVSGQNCSVNAGVPQTICINSRLFLHGSYTAPIKPGSQVLWTQIAGPTAVIVDPTDPNTEVTNLIAGNDYTFRISTTCADGALTYQDITHKVTALTIANAGTDATYCPGTHVATLSANTPGTGESGVWTILSGSGLTIDHPTSPNSTISLSESSSGPVSLRWTISNTSGTCESSDDVVITNRGGAAVVSAGTDQTLDHCFSSTQSTTLSGSYAGSGIDGQQGTWSIVSGPNVPVIANVHLNNSRVSNLIEGTYVFRWTVAGSCTSGSDEVQITVPAATANVTGASITGGDQAFCDGSIVSTVLTGSIPRYVNESVLWVQTGGPTLPAGSIVNPNSPITTVNNLVSPNSYSFSYTITNPITVCSSSTSMTVSYVPNPPTLSLVTASPVLLGCNVNSTDIDFTAGGSGVTQYRFVSGPACAGLTYPTEWASAGASPLHLSSLNCNGTFQVQMRRVTTTGGECSTPFVDIAIVTSYSSVASNAGTDQVLNCNVTTTNLIGNDPTLDGGTGEGTWSQVSGPSAIILTSPHSPTLGIGDLLPNGVYIFRWLISGGPSCPSSQDDVRVITAQVAPGTYSAGDNQSVCFNAPLLLNAETPKYVFEVGTWSASPSSGVKFSDVNDPKATVTGLLANTTYTFTWTVRNGCASNTSSMIVDVTNTAGPVVANAGADQCLVSGTTGTTLDGNNPTPGIGTWSLVSGPNTPIFNSGDYHAAVTGLTDGIYVFQWSIASGGCLPSTDQMTLTIDHAIVSPDAGANQQVCGNSAVLTTVLGAEPATGAGIWSQVSGNASTISSPSTYTTPITGLVPGTYTYRYTITNGGCTAYDEVSLFVSEPPSPAVIPLSSTGVCGSSSVTLSANAISSGTGLWSIISGPNTPAIMTPGAPETVVSGMITGSYVFRWSVVGGPFCTSDNFDEITVTVTQSADAGADQSYCEAITSVNLIGTIASTGTWLQVGTTPNIATITKTSANTAIASGLVPGVYTFEYSISAVGCTSTDQMTVTLYAPPSTANAGADQSLCGASSFSLLASSPTSGTGKWTVLAGPSGYAGSFANASNYSTTYTPTAGIYGIFVFQWTVSNSTCSNADQVRITNYQPASSANAGADQTSVCTSTVTMHATTPAVGLGTWTLLTSAAGATPVITDPTDPQTTITNLVPATYPATYTFRWTVANGSPTCASNIDDVTISVILPAVAANAGADQNLCNSTTGFTLSGNDVSPSTGVWSLVSGPNTPTFDPNTQNPAVTGITNGVYVFKYTSTATSGCTSEDLVTITNYTQPVAEAGSNQNICQFTSLTMHADTPVIGNGAWSYVSGPGSPVFTQESSPTSPVVGTTTGTYVFRWTVTNGTCTASDDVQVIINALPSQALAGPDQNVCAGFTETTLAGNTPGTGSSGLWTLISGPGSIAIETPDSPVSKVTGLTTPGTYVLQWENSIGSCKTTDQMVITVYPATTTANAGIDQILCNQTATTLSGNTPLNANETGQWVKLSGPNAPTITTPTQGTTTVTGLTTGTYVFRWRISSGTCPYSEDVVTIINNPIADAGPDQVTSSTCGLSTVTLAGNNPAPSTGSWSIYSGYTGSETFGSDSDYHTTFTGVAGNSYTLRWTITATGPAGTACEAVTHDDVQITFNLSTVVDNPGNQSTCPGSFTATAFSGGSAGTVYRWVNNNTTIGLAATGTGDLPVFTAVNTGSAAKVATITVTPEYPNVGGTTCYGQSKTFTITVKPTPTIISASSKTICSNSNVSYSPVSATTGTNFSWTAAKTSGTVTGFSASGWGSISDVLVNTGTTDGQVTYTITPEAGGCPGTPFDLVVTVHASPDVSASDKTICSSNPAGIALSSSVAGTTFYYAAPSISGAAGNITGGTARLTPGSSAVISDYLVNTTASVQTATYVVYPIKDGCVGSPATVVVTVNPEPAASGTTVTTCSNVALNIDLLSRVTRLQTGATFTYTVSSSNAGSIPPAAARSVASNANITDLYTNTTNSPVNITYTVTPYASNGCSGHSFVMTATINPKPVISNKTETTCSGSALNINLQNLLPAGNMRTGSVFSYTVASSDETHVPAGAARSTASSANITDTYSNKTNSAVTITYTITPTSGQGCVGAPFTYTITINPEPVYTGVLNTTVCSDSNIGVVLPATDDDGLAISKYNISATKSSSLTGTATTGTNLTGVNLIRDNQFNNVTSGDLTVEYTVTPISGSCQGSSFKITVTVKPEPVLTTSLTQSLCADGTFQATASRSLTTVNTIAGTTFTYAAPSKTPGLTGGTARTTGSTDPITDVFTNNTNTVQTATYSVIPTAGSGCVGNAIDVKINVAPRSLINSALTATTCEGAFLYDITSNVASSTFTWSRAEVSGITPATGSGSTYRISENLVNSTTSPIVVHYLLTPTGPTGCAGTPSTLDVTVKPRPVVTTNAYSSVFCTGGTTDIQLSSDIAGTNFTWAASLYSGSNTTGFSGGSGTDITQTLQNNSSAIAVVRYVVTPIFDGCSGTPINIDIQINPKPAITSSAAKTICNGTSTNYTVTSDVVGATFAISSATCTLGSITGYSTTLSGVNLIDQTLTNSGTSPGQVTYVLTPTGPTPTSCPGVSVDLVVTVNPTPNVSASPASQTICNGSKTNIALSTTITDVTVTYPWTATTISGTASYTASGIGTPIQQTITNSSTSPAVVRYTITPTIGTCTGTPITVDVTVNPSASVTKPSDQVVCNGGSTALVTFATTNTGGTTKYTWTNDNTSINLAANSGGEVENISSFIATNPGTKPVTATITVTPTFSNGGATCSGTAQSFTITVNPTPNVSASPTSQTICSGTNTNIALTTTITGVTVDYSWTASTISGAATYTATGTGTPIQQTITNASTSQAVVRYNIIPTIGSCTGTPITVDVTVNPAPQVNQPDNQVVCNDGSTSLVTFGTINTDGTTTYSWTNNKTSINLPATGTGNISSFIAKNAGTLPVVATIVVIPHYSNGGTSCDGPSKTFTITVNPSARVNDPADQTVCNGGSTALVTFGTTNTGGTTTYTWANDNTSINLAASSVVNAVDIPSFTATNSGTAPVTATITVTPTFSNGGASCSGTAQSFTITVNPTPNVSASPASQTICTGSKTDIALSTTISGVTVTYPWTATTISGTASYTASGIGTPIQQTITNSSTSPAVVRYTIIPTIGTCTGTPITVDVTVNPSASVTKPSDQVVCNGGSTALVTFATTNTGGTTSYTWTNNNTSINLAADSGGDAGSISSFIATNTGTTPAIATITVTPTFSNGGVSCSGTARSFTITVNPSAQVNDPVDQVVCKSTLTTVHFTTDRSGGTTTYAWTNDNTAIGLLASGNGDISFTSTNSTTAQIVAHLTVMPTFKNGLVSCTGTPQTFTITVNPAPQVNQPANQVVCNGASTSAVSFGTTNTDGTTTYSWTNNKTSINLLASGNADIPSFIATNNGTAPVVASIVVTPHYSNGGTSCDGPTKTFTITVNPTAQVNDPADQVVCNNTTATVNFTTTRSGGTTSYTWTNDNTAIGLMPNGNGDISFTATNITNAQIIAHLTVTPTFTNGLVSCTGTPQTFTIAVNPAPQVIPQVDQVVCNGAYTSDIIFSTKNTDGITTYTWLNDNTSINLPASGIGNIASFKAINTGTAPEVATIQVTPHYSNGGTICDGPTIAFTITVNPTAQVNDPADQVVCNGSTTALVMFETNRSGGITSYTWTNDTPSIGLAANSGGVAVSIPHFTAINTGTSPVTATITVTPTFTNGPSSCTGTAQSFTITVNPTAQVNDPADQVVCNNTLTTVHFTTDRSGGTTTYAWTNDNTAIGLLADGNGDISFTSTNSTSAQVVAHLTVTPTFKNGLVSCTGTPQTFTITVNPAPQVNQPGNQVVCNGASTTTVSFGTTNTDGTTTYSWTNNKTSINLLANGTGDITSFNATNTGTTPIVATIVVTPHYSNGGTSCDGPTKTFTITVNPTAQVDQPANQVICNGSASTAVAFSTTKSGGTTTYSWVNDKPSINLPATGNGDITSFNATNTGTTPVVATIVVTPHYSNGGTTCDGPTKTFTITVNPTAQVNQPGNQVLCNGGSTSLVSFGTTNTGGLTTYTWVNNQTSINLPATGNGDIASFNATNTGTTPIVATIVVTPHYSNDGTICDGPTKAFTITVNPTAQVNQPADQVICNGSASTAVAFSTTRSGGTTTYSWVNDKPSINLPATGNGDITSFNATNTGTTPVVATIVVTPHYSNGGTNCDGPSKTFTITVNPTAQVNQPGNQVLCNGGSTSLVSFGTTNTGGVTTYTWINNQTSINLPATGNGDIASFNATNTGTTPIVATIVVTPHYSNDGTICDGPTKAFTITVNPTAQVNQPANQVICNGSTSTAIAFSTTKSGGTTTYSWINDKPSINLPATGNGDIASFNATNTGTTPVVATIVVTPHYSNGGTTCDGPSKTFTITVNPTAQVNQPGNQVLCNGGSTSLVSFGTTNTGGITTYTWINNQTSINLPATGNGDITSFTAINTGTVPVVATIVVTPHYSNDGTICDGPTKTFTITVNPTARVNKPSNQVVCNGGSTTLVTFATTNTGGTTTYTWTNNNTSINLAANSGGEAENIPSFIATNSGTIPVTATITITPTFRNGGVSCSGTAQTFTITVNPTAQVNDPVDQVVCNNTLTTVHFTTDRSGGTTTYAWTNDNTAIGLLANGDGDISFTATNSTTAQIIAHLTVTPTFTNGSVSCTGTPQTFTITVNPASQVNQPGNLVVCNGTSTTDVSFSTMNTDGITTYTWINNNTSINLPANGIGDIASFNATNTGTAPVVATIVVTPHYSNGGTSCDGPTKTFTITVNPTAQVNDPADQVVCAGGSTALVTFGTTRTGGTTTYTWINDTPSIGLAANSGGSVLSIPSFTAVNNGTAPVTATITVTPTFTNGSVSCTGTAQSFTITVNPTAQVNDPADQVICNGGSTSLVTFGTTHTGGITTYTWTNDTPSIGLAANSGGNALSIPSFTAVNNGTSPVTATITVTPTFTNGLVSCTGTAQSFTITVNPTALVNDPADQVICNGGSTSLVTFGTTRTGGTTTYTWTNDTPSIGLAANSGGNALSIPSFTAVNNGAAPVIATITVTPTFTNGSVSCTGTAQSFTITVNPTAQVNDPADQVICNGGSTSLVTFGTTRSGGTTTYTWINNTPSIGLAANSGGDALSIPSFTAVNNGTSPVTATITVTPIFTNELVSCTGTAQSFTITVNPTAQVNDPADQVICNGGSTSLVTFGTTRTGGTTTYTWINDTPSIGLAANSGGNALSIPSFTAVNTGTTPVTATITVTPTFTNGGVSCTGTAQSFTITVNPTAQMNDPADQVICNGGSTSLVTFGTTHSGGTTTYTWTNDTPSIGLAANSGGNALSIPSFTAVNNGTAPVTATITITPTFTNGSVSCTGTTQSFTITVNPTAQVDDPANQMVCHNTLTTVNFTTDRFGGTTTYAWTNDQTAIGLPANGNGNISFTAVNTGTLPITATIVVIPTFTNGSISCTGTAQTFTITVNPTAQVNDPADQVICNGGSTSLVTFGTTHTGGITTYTWTNDTPSIGLAASSGGNALSIPSFTAINTGTAPVTATITVTPTFTNGLVSCIGTAQTFTITVNPTPILSSPLNAGTVCSQSTFNYTPTSATAGTSFTWSRAKVDGISNAAATGSDNPAEILINTTADQKTVTYVYSLTANGCNHTQNVTVIVNPKPVVTAGQTQNLCADATGHASANLALTTTPSLGGSVSYSWAAPVMTGGMTYVDHGSASGAIMDEFINPTREPQTATYTVIPTSSSSLGSCLGEPSTVIITVNPKPIVTPGLTQTICSGTQTHVVVTSSTPQVTFTYGVPVISGAAGNITGGLARTIPSADPITDVLTNTTSSVQTATYRVKAWINGCAGEEENVVISVIDGYGPTITSAAGSLDASLDCSDQTSIDAAAALEPTATNHCSTPPTIHLISDITTPDANCPHAYVRVRTWNFTDCCGIASANFVQTITVTDPYRPILGTPYGALDVVKSCSDLSGIAAALAMAPTAMDNCTAIPTIHLISDVVTPTSGCGNAYHRVRTWNFTDECNNVSADYVQTITVIDKTAPVISTVPASLDQTLECSDLSGIAAALAMTPQATDNCTTVPTLNVISDHTTPDGTCPSAYIRVRTWNFTDGCGNASDIFTQTITVIDQTPPVMACPATSFLREISGLISSYTTIGSEFDYVSASDNSGSVTVTNNLNGLSSLNGYAFPVGPTTVTWTAADACGNVTQCSSVVTVKILNADLSIVKLIDTERPTAGSQVVFTLVVSNFGPGGAAGIKANDPLPSGFTYISDDGNGAYDPITGIWTIGSMISGDAKYLKIKALVNVPATGTNFVNVASVSANEFDPDPTNNNARVEVIILDPHHDDGNPVSCLTGGTALTNVLSNDLINGVPIDPSQVDLSFVSSSHPGITLSGSDVLVATGTPAGSYTLTYQICLKAIPSNCATATVTVPVTCYRAGLTATKRALETNFSAVGDLIHYAIEVTNISGETIYNINVVDDNAVITSGNSISSLNAGSTVTVLAYHIITQNDLDNGQVFNSAHASGAFSDAATSTDYTQMVTVTGAQRPQVTATLFSNETTYRTVGEVINYTVEIFNCGTVTLHDLIVSNTNAIINSGNPISSLAPRQTVTVTAQKVVTQNDINVGEIVNEAKVVAKDPKGNLTKDDSNPVTLFVNQTPVLILSVLAKETTFNTVGEILHYDITVKNFRNTRISETKVKMSNAVMDGNGSIYELASGKSTTLTATHVVTQKDLDDGKVVNVASASGSDYFSKVTAVSNESAIFALQQPGLSIEKTAIDTTFNKVGDIISYTNVITNTGNVKVTSLVFTDPDALINGDSHINALNPGESGSITSTHTINQVDLNNGFVEATAGVTGIAPTGELLKATSNKVLVMATIHPAMSLTITAAEMTYNQTGDVLHYAIEVRNTGNVTLTDIRLSNPSAAFNQGNLILSLMPGATSIVNAEHQITHEEVLAGEVVTQSTAQAVDPTGTAVTASSNSLTVLANSVENISVTEVAVEPAYHQVGDTIHYTISVKNHGKTSVSNIVVDNSNATILGSPIIAEVKESETRDIQAIHRVTQSDLDTGTISTLAHISGSFSDGKTIEAQSNPVILCAVRKPAITARIKASETIYKWAGDQIHYTIELENTGNQTISDIAVSANGEMTLPPVTGLSIAPGKTANLLATYPVVIADLDAGKVVRSVNVTGLTPDHLPVNASSQEIAIIGWQKPELSTSSSAGETTFSKVGEVLHFTTIVKNTGNVTLISTAATDPNAVIITIRPITTLMPGEAVELASSHMVTQADLDAGTVVSVTTATGFDLKGNTIEKKGNSVVVNALQQRELSITNTPGQPTFQSVGEQVDFNLMVRNTGNVTLYNIKVTDPDLTMTSSENFSRLLPGEGASVSAMHIITLTDLDAGKLMTTAKAVGTDQNGKHTTNLGNEVTVSGVQHPNLAVTLSASDSIYVHEGDAIRYVAVVKNTGNVTLTNIFMTDEKGVVDFNRSIRSLAPGESDSIWADHRVTLADINAGKIITIGSINGYTLNSDRTAFFSNEVIVKLSIINYNLTNFPNPFTYETTITFDLPEKGEAILKVFDMNGKEIEQLEQKVFNEGRNYVHWKTTKTQMGLYVIKLYYQGHQAIKIVSVVY